MSDGDIYHMKHIEAVALGDLRELRRKEETYRGSWKRRGGVGAFMMLARKWDRLEPILSMRHNYDVFAGVGADPSGADGSVLAEVRDLRRYLLLVEAEMINRGVVAAPDCPAPQSPPPAPPGEAEDDTAWPWVVDARQRDELTAGMDPVHAESLYTKWAADSFYLTPFLYPLFEEIVRGRGQRDPILACYKEPFGYPDGSTVRILDLSKVPKSWRFLWGPLRRELNYKEWDGLPYWQKLLYERDEKAAKHILRPEFTEWDRDRD